MMSTNITRIERALILEDAVFVREIEKKNLRALGFSTFVETNSAAEAVALLKEGKYSLFIVDLNVYEGSGEGAVREARLFNKDIPIVVITAFPEQLSQTPEISNLINCVIRKPFTDAEFCENIKKLIHG